MVGIQGVNGAPEPVGPKQVSSDRNRAPQTPAAPSQDGVEISAQASRAAAVQNAVQAASNQSEIREELVAEAKDRIEQGAHRLQEVVLQVAARVAQFVE